MPVVCIVRFCFSFVFGCVFWFGMFIFVLEFVFLFSGRVVFFCFGISAFVSLWFVFLDFVSVFYFFLRVSGLCTQALFVYVHYK